MKQQISVSNLQPGMYVDELDRPWLGTPFMFQGFAIKDWEEVRKLQQYCNNVTIDTGEPETHYKPEPHATSGTNWASHRFSTKRLNITPSHHADESPDHHAFLAEVREIKQTYDNAHQYLTDVLNDVRMGQEIDTKQAKSLVNKMVDSVLRNENALAMLSQIKSRDEYTALHSINVCILTLVFGKHLGLSDQNLRILGIGALLHDIGKMRIPLEILNKPDALTAAETAVMHQHPTIGYEILKKKPGIPDSAMDVARSHHERFDGSGYPQHLKGDEIKLFATITSIADVYDAITTNRIYHDGISPHEALRLMYEDSLGSFSLDLLEEFIKCHGIYPIGSIVELSSGEVGVVLTINHAKHLHPIVLLVLDPDKHPFPQRKLINLEQLDRTGSTVTIKKILASGAYGINVQQILIQEGNFSNLVT